jgi:hypothetical protein
MSMGYKRKLCDHIIAKMELWTVEDWERFDPRIGGYQA